MILNGQKYRLIPVKAEWEISCIQSICPCGHNGQSLPKDSTILSVRLGKETFSIGDCITEGRIKEFVYLHEYKYVQAKIDKTDELVDIDLLKKT